MYDHCARLCHVEGRVQIFVRMHRAGLKNEIYLPRTAMGYKSRNIAACASVNGLLGAWLSRGVSVQRMNKLSLPAAAAAEGAVEGLRISPSAHLSQRGRENAVICFEIQITTSLS
jgi:hypothetical protein